MESLGEEVSHLKMVPGFHKSLVPVVGCWLEWGPVVGVRGD